MKNHHTVVVIGGGPAGSSASYTLATRGIDVGVIDKSIFPRAKLCGGLLTLRSKKIFTQVFDSPWDKAFEYKANGAKFFHQNKLLNSVDNYSELYFTCRTDFDDYLLRMAESNGASLYLGSGVAAIDLNARVCRLRSGDKISYDYLIGADGVNSVVAKTIRGTSFDKSRIAFALEIEADRAAIGREVTVPEIYFGVARWGYAWVFPKKNTLTVGVGGLRVKNPNIRETFTAFLREIFGKVPQGKIKGHYIPFGDYKKEPGIERALLAGDAAGLVEPITGEGIAFAMQSGYFAGLSIAETIDSADPAAALEIYKKKYSEITHVLDYANILRYLIFPRPSEYLFIRVFPKTSRLPHKHMDLMADTINYEEYVRYLVATGLKSVAKGTLFMK